MPRADELRPQCPECKGAMPKSSAMGRPRKYCSDRCRRNASRRRKRATTPAWSTSTELATMPADPKTLEQRTALLVGELLDGRPAAPVEDQLAQAVIELTQIAFTLRSITPELTPALAARAGDLAETVGRACRRIFPEVAA